MIKFFTCIFAFFTHVILAGPSFLGKSYLIISYEAAIPSIISWVQLSTRYPFSLISPFTLMWTKLSTEWSKNKIFFPLSCNLTIYNSKCLLSFIVVVLQGIFHTQRLNLCLPHCRRILHHWATREDPFYHLQWQQMSAMLQRRYLRYENPLVA